MSRTKKIAIFAIIAMVLTLMPTALFAATAESDRLAGGNRIATALDIASAGTWGTSVVLAPADDANLVDALAAAPLAGQENAPILLTFKGSLDTDVKAKIKALGATKVYVIGAISDAVAAEVDAIDGVSVEALKGAGRQATADAVNAKLTSPAGTFVVGYDAIPDALSAASFAAKNKYAIVLANADGTVDSAKLVGATKYIVGGTTKVKDIAGVTRLSGENRYATNADVASKLGFSYDRVYVANGVTCVDALAVAPLAAKYGAFVALASGSDVAAASVVNAKLTTSSKVIAVGGTTAVPAAVVAKVAYSAPASIAVQSITAMNLNQIKVVFNNKVDSTTAQIVSNYSLGGTALTVGTDAAKLLSDEKTVIVTLATGTITTQGTTKVFKVNPDAIQEKSTGVLVPKAEQELTFTDVTAPTVTEVKVTGNKKLTVTFSEAVNPNAWKNSSYKVDGQSLASFGGNASEQTGFYAVANTLSNQAVINFDAALASGTHTLTIGADSNNKILDAVSFALASTDVTFTVASAAADLTIQSITGNVNGKVTVTFNEKIDNLATGFGTAFTINGVQPATSAPAKDADDNRIVNMTFAAGVVKEGSNVLEIVKNTVADIYGNKYAPSADARVSFSAVKDTTAPTVTNAYAISESVIRVFFSENVDNTYFTNSNFVLKSASGSVKVGGSDVAKAWTTIAFVAGSTDKVDLTIPAGIFPTLGKAQYTLTIKNVADTAGNPVVETAKSFTTIDSTKPTLAAAPNVLVNTTTRTVQVKFNEPMDATTIGNKANYYYSIGGAAFAAITDATTISVADDNKSVTFTFPSTIVPTVATTQIRIMAVKDAAGNALAGGTVDTTLPSVASSTAGFPLVKADTLKIYSDSNKVWITFDVDQVLDSVDRTDFAYVAATGVISDTPAGAGVYVPDSAVRVNKTVTLTWTNATAKDAIKEDGKAVKIASGSVFSGTTNAEGATLKAGSSDITSLDYVAPKLIATNPVAVQAGGKSVTITFNENLKNNAALYADDFVILVGGVMIDTSKVTASVAANVLTLTWTDTPTAAVAPAGVNTIVKAKAANDIQDESGNAFVPTSDDTAGLGVTN